MQVRRADMARSPRVFLAAAVALALIVGSLVASERSSAALARAATAFLNSLSPEQRQKAAFPFDSGERTHWNFIPTEAFPRNGLTLGEMSDAQRTRAHDLLKAGLSQRGYLTATSIMD